MTLTTAPAPVRPRGRRVTIRGRDVPVILPNRHDPRLPFAAAAIGTQILGQTVLGFKLSIAQILVTIAICATAEVVLAYRHDHILLWPTSGMLTGNSIALLLRASGTRHGDWWSLHGIQYFVLAAATAVVVKHYVRPNGRHVFNPSNIALVTVLLVVGPRFVFPQYLWWGPNRAGVLAAVVVIAGGGGYVLKRLKMLPMAMSFLIPFAVLVASFALAGRHFIAIWHEGPMRGWAYWSNICLSPELLVFTFFMITDPKTAARTRRGRLAFGACTAVVAAVLVLFQTTEFGIKLSILSSLVVTCAAVPWIDRLAAVRARSVEAAAPWTARLRDVALKPAAVAALVIAVAAPVDTLRLAGNRQLTSIELGQTGSNPQ